MLSWSQDGFSEGDTGTAWTRDNARLEVYAIADVRENCKKKRPKNEAKKSADGNSRVGNERS